MREFVFRNLEAARAAAGQVVDPEPPGERFVGRFMRERPELEGQAVAPVLTDSGTIVVRVPDRLADQMRGRAGVDVERDVITGAVPDVGA